MVLEATGAESGGIGAIIKGVINELIGSDKTAIVVPFGHGMFNINQSVVDTWIVMLVLLVVCLILTTNLKVHNISKRQALAESIVTGLRKVVSSSLGSQAAEYTDYLIVVLGYIGACNLMGVFGKTPPTMDLNITVSLALMSIILVEAAGIRKKKVGGWLKSFTKPIWVITPMNILEVGIKPLSLCMRLFGNVLGATVIMELLKEMFKLLFEGIQGNFFIAQFARDGLPALVPAIFSLYFDFFDGLLQAYVFVFLTSLYIKEATETEEE
ncbi:FoF1 ATP synthase subunit A [Butyrivibrio sp. NC3005]|uniref:FoF1 ATP synthase subunit A n=1 Tax=Butyrivibrio sp. NC3005 TaxID=1280685 RepID=UPI0003FCBF56|nr:FoF1 ATP synthase subunit a [Butyrivibrio sp. NC3005]